MRLLFPVRQVAHIVRTTQRWRCVQFVPCPVHLPIALSGVVVFVIDEKTRFLHDRLYPADAVLAVVAPFAKAGFSIKELVHLGNVAGAIKVGILGHHGHVSKQSLLDNL